MANSKYEYVKLFEADDEVMYPNIIVVRIDGRHFKRFSEVHEFEKPNDERGLKLMNSCACAVLEEYPDIICSYGYSDEYSFVFKLSTKFYQRRASKVMTLIVSYFTSNYTSKWKEFFSQDLCYAPSFRGHTVGCATMEALQAYLAWRQNDCHVNNLFNTCLYTLVKSGKSEEEAQAIIKNADKQEKNELLFQQFGINYKKLPEIFRQGSFVMKGKVEEIVKFSKNGSPVRRSRRKVVVIHSENITSTSFWNSHSTLLEELGSIAKHSGKNTSDFVRSFQSENKLMLSTWIVVRIDGCHFHRFSEVHGFEKPNDVQALNLMNSCAVAVLEEFCDIVFAYGVSDEYSFVLSKDSQMYQRLSSGIVSAIVSTFSSNYVLKWEDFCQQHKLNYPPSFDGRSVCYPSSKILRDYLTWRQVDCHINNQYNTCFWMLVKSGMSKSEAQNFLKGTQTQEKNDLLLHQFGIEYNNLPAMFRLGSSVYSDETKTYNIQQKASIEGCPRKVIVEHCNIIDDNFWKGHTYILNQQGFSDEDI
uniref:tRNA(His) guanylyltransferase n=1 Tax=Kalanchoe fedtschenkoi TaxID=63787 RepID=A0A7N0TZG9_KALFE